MKIFFGAMVIAVLALGGYIVSNLGGQETGPAPSTSGSNVSVVDGTQIITLSAKGGYQPKRSVAAAGLPTILRVNTNGTFDCSSALRIPSLKVSENLPMNGTTDIKLGTLSAGTIPGNCGMGMYPFEIQVN
jgi:plastocyanin domain-containing protein